VLKRALFVSAACIALTGCATDKLSMSSEVGGSSRAAAAGLTSSNGGATGTSGTSSSSGTGQSIGDILGSGPLGTVVGSLPAVGAGSASPGAGPVDDILTGIVGSDTGGGLIDTVGVISASLAGGNDGLLNALLAGSGSLPTASVPSASALPVVGGLVATALTNLPALPVGGGAASLPALPALPADTVGTVSTVLASVPVAGTAVGAVLGSLPGSVATTAAPSGVGAASAGSVADTLSSVPAAGTVTSTATGALAPVVTAVNNVPVVGTTVGGVVGGLLGGAH
jgi:hypothetical protein